MHSFKKGDRVQLTEDYERAKRGLIATVVFTGDDAAPTLNGTLGLDFGDVLPFTHRLQGKLDEPTGYWVDPNNLKLLNETSMSAPAQTKTEVLLVEITRSETGKSVLRYEIPAKIERLFKNMTADIKESSKWPGLKFYLLPELVKNPQYKTLCHNYELFDNFGDDLIQDNGRMNIAWLRTVGGKGELELPSNFGDEEGKQLVRNCVAFIRDYYNNFHRPVVIRGELNIEE